MAVVVLLGRGALARARASADQILEADTAFSHPRVLGAALGADRPADVNSLTIAGTMPIWK